MKKKLMFSIYLMSFATLVSSQNVGIGISTPANPLDVRSVTNSHLVRFDGPGSMYMSIFENGLYRGYIGSFAGNAEDVDFGTGGTNTTGKVHLTIQANPRLTIGSDGNVGIGNTNPQWKLDVNGAMQLNGRLFVSGSSGVTGQVLTSNGLNAPSWTTLSGAFDNTVRFEASFINNGALTVTPTFVYTQALNTSPTSVTITSASIIINKSGLYHLEGYINSNYTFTSAPEILVQQFQSSAGSVFLESEKAALKRDPTVALSIFKYINFGRFVREVYITAPTVISSGFINTFNSGAGGATLTNTFHEGRISGYLINE